MLKTLDLKFRATLDDDAKLDKRLSELASVRFNSGIVVAMMVISTTLMIFMVWIPAFSNPIPHSYVPAPMFINQFIQVILLAVFLIKALLAHLELRSHLIFRKLRDDQSVITP